MRLLIKLKEVGFVKKSEKKRQKKTLKPSLRALQIGDDPGEIRTRDNLV